MKGWVTYSFRDMRLDAVPVLKAKPSEYMASGNWFYSTEPEEASLPYAMDRVGEDKVLFASDYSHWDGMFPHVVSTIRGRRVYLRAQDRNPW